MRTDDPLSFSREIRKIVTVYSPVRELMTEEPERRPMHSHLWREILMVFSGSCKFNLNGQPYIAEPGTVFLIDPRVSHSCRYAPGDHDLAHLWISSCSAMFGSMVYKKDCGDSLSSGESFFLSSRVWAQVQDRWEQLSRVKRPDENLILDHMKVPLSALIDDYMFKLKYRKPGAKSLSVVKIMLQHIRVNNGRDCSWRKLEQITGFTRYYLAHRFKNECGFSVRDYIKHIRIEYAAQALNQGCKQKEIASELGFASPASYWNWLNQHRNQVEKIRRTIEMCYDTGNRSGN